MTDFSTVISRKFFPIRRTVNPALKLPIVYFQIEPFIVCLNDFFHMIA